MFSGENTKNGVFTLVEKITRHPSFWVMAGPVDIQILLHEAGTEKALRIMRGAFVWKEDVGWKC